MTGQLKKEKGKDFKAIEFTNMVNRLLACLGGL